MTERRRWNHNAYWLEHCILVLVALVQRYILCMKQHHSGRHVRTIDPTVVDSRKNHVRYATKVCPCLFVRYIIWIYVYNYVATQHSLEKNTKDVYNCTRFHFLETKCSQEKITNIYIRYHRCSNHLFICVYVCNILSMKISCCIATLEKIQPLFPPAI